MSETKKIIGENVKRFLEAKGVKNNWVMDRLGISKGSFYHFLKGEGNVDQYERKVLQLFRIKDPFYFHGKEIELPKNVKEKNDEQNFMDFAALSFYGEDNEAFRDGMRAFNSWNWLMFSSLYQIHLLYWRESTLINQDNIERVVHFNQAYLSAIKSKIELLKSSGDPQIASKPLEYIKTYLYENAHVLEFPIKNADYGGLVYYHNKSFYIQINSAQPKIYENFMWAHEFCYFYFDKEKVKKREENFVLVDSIFDEKERLPNLFAGEFLINDFILERKFNFLKKESNYSLADIAIYLIPVFEVPYKAIVIKLAQNQLIGIDDAKEIIDYDYKDNLSDEMDQTLFSASYKIKIDNYRNLISKAAINMNEEDHVSILSKYNELYNLLLDWREELGGGSKK